MNKQNPRSLDNGPAEAGISFANLDKGLVLQEKRIFGEPKPNDRACCHLITKILYLLDQGEPFTKKEATDTFFAVTKLFQSKDVQLRRMVYLVLKELAPHSEQDHIIIVVASLTKDMNDKNEIYRANAIRVLCRIIESSMLAQVERYLKQSVVAKEAYVSSAAIVAGLHLMRVSPDIIKRWVNEVQQALSSRFVMVQYHALGLLYEIKRHDRLAVAKLVQSMTKGGAIKSPFAQCLLIRYAAQAMHDDRSGDSRSNFEYLESCLRSKSEQVILEAARAICELPGVSARELTPAITVLQLFLSSTKATMRFAAVRTLNRVAQSHPLPVTVCNLDMEHLIDDTNRSIATFAITTLLKTGSAGSVDRLMKKINSFMSDITDEFKVVVIDAIRSLALKFPDKHRSLMSFLAGALRDEGGFVFKKAIVDAILDIITQVPESKEIGLTHLCEFIEDCEFAYLSTKILNLLASEGPATSTPSKFIRYIYNRVSLESAPVRAAAVTALARFGERVVALRAPVFILLRRCVEDADDEVRDRAACALRLLAAATPAESNVAARPTRLADELPLPAAALEQRLMAYVNDAAAVAAGPFDMAAAAADIRAAAASAPVLPSAKSSSNANNSMRGAPATALSGAAVGNAQSRYAAQLADVPALFECGAPFSSSAKPAPLTEAETEYVVSCVKHVCAAGFLIVQFNCTNTLSDKLLKNVRVRLTPTDDADTRLKPHVVVPLAKLPYGVDGTTYVSFRLPSDARAPPTMTLSATLKFDVHDVDAQGVVDESGYEDEYALEELAISVADFVRPSFVSNFAEDWDALGDANEAVETYALSQLASLAQAVVDVTRYLGMQAADGSDVVKENSKKHILYLAGRFVGDVPVLVRVRMRNAKDDGIGVNMEVTVRSSDREISTSIAGAIG